MSDRLPAPDQLQAVLFDLDDTLIDARGSWRAGFAESIAELHAAEPALQALGSPEAIYDGYFRHYTEAAHRAAGGGEWQERFTLEAYERLIGEHLRPDPRARGAAHRPLPRRQHPPRRHPPRRYRDARSGRGALPTRD